MAGEAAESGLRVIPERLRLAAVVKEHRKPEDALGRDGIHGVRRVPPRPSSGSAGGAYQSPASAQAPEGSQKHLREGEQHLPPRRALQRMPLSSEKIRSGKYCAAAPGFPAAPRRFFSSMVRPNRAAKRSARKMRSASSRKRSPGSPTQRRTPFLRSSRPPKSSADRARGCTPWRSP